jgi:hypothetical protein
MSGVEISIVIFLECKARKFFRLLANDGLLLASAAMQLYRIPTAAGFTGNFGKDSMNSKQLFLNGVNMNNAYL